MTSGTIDLFKWMAGDGCGVPEVVQSPLLFLKSYGGKTPAAKDKKIKGLICLSFF